MELIVFYVVLSYFGSLDTAAIGDCPPGQVLHFNPENKKGLCCIPLQIQRGYEAVPCSVDGTEDGFQKCQNGTHQQDETSSRHMPECIVDPQCTIEGIKRDYRCIDDYCWPVCICSLEHGKCGLNPFDCTDINKITCPSTVLPNCSCAPPEITSTLPASSSSTVKPISLESSVPTPTNESWIDSTKIIDKFDTTEDGTDKQNKWKIPVSIGCTFLVLVVVVVVVLCICYRRRKCNILMQNGDSQENGQNTAAIEMEEQEMLPSDSLVTAHAEPTEHEEETQPILSWKSGQDESVGHEVDAQPLSPEDSEESAEGEATLSGVPNMSNLPDIWSPFSSGLFQSHAHTIDQHEVFDESERDETHAKTVVSSANQEEEHHSGAEAMPNMRNLPDIGSTFSSGLFQSHANTIDQQEVSDESERDETHVKSVISSVNQEEEHHSGAEGMPNMSNLPDIWSPFSSGLFQSHAHTIDQQEVSDESERDETHAKSVVSSANQEEEHHSGGEATLSEFGLYTEGVEPTLFSNGLWSDFSRSILHGTGSDVKQAGSDIQKAGSEGSDVQQAGSDIAQAVSDIAQAESVSQRELDEEDDNVHQLLD